jgi:hypothetical protein
MNMINSEQPAPAPPPDPAPARRARRIPPALTPWLVLAAVALGALGFWYAAGRHLWSGYKEYQASRQAAEDSVPIGYIGLNYRKSYNNRSPEFHFEKDGRKLLWAGLEGDGGAPLFYDVTEADAEFPVKGLSGGFGRDSIPGIDYPILDPPSSARWRRFRARQAVHGATLESGPRAYPADLLSKIEVVNDVDGANPFVVVLAADVGQARSYRRDVAGRAVTFGTAGYTSEQRPVLYDRRTKSLWLARDDALACVSGELKGTRLPAYRPPRTMTWAEWTAEHPRTLVLVGNDRQQPLPVE